LSELLPIISGEKGRQCQLEGNLTDGIFAIGQSIGLIEEIKPVRNVIEDVLTEAETIMKRINQIVN
jgi:nitronate monooxygenase